MENEIYKHFVVFAALAFWPAAIYMVRKWRIGKEHSFSHHAASEKRAFYLFATAVSLETVLYVLFVYGWFVPTFHMGITFQILLGMIAFGHLVTGLVPEAKGWAFKTHRWASYTVAWLFLPALVMLAAGSTIPTTARWFSGIFCVELLYLWYLFTKPKTHESFLIYQALYIATLPIALILATYLK